MSDDARVYCQRAATGEVEWIEQSRYTDTYPSIAMDSGHGFVERKLTAHRLQVPTFGMPVFWDLRPMQEP